jgi:hypothetical protein
MGVNLSRTMAARFSTPSSILAVGDCVAIPSEPFDALRASGEEIQFVIE